MRRVSVPSDRVAVMGAGASSLVLELVAAGYRSIDAVDISAAALEQLRGRLGDEAASVRFVVADVRDVCLDGPVDVWHDRATFHFLTAEVDRSVYAVRAAQAVRAGGFLVLATFAQSGPEQCSGLPVARHDAGSLQRTFSASFVLVESFEDVHVTPWGAEQLFTYALLRRNRDE